MNVSRIDLLKRLLSVVPAVTNSATTRQSDCIVLKNNRFYSMNRETACSIQSGLGDLEGAVRAKSLIAILKKMKEEDIELNLEGKVLILKGKGKITRLTMEAEIKMPFGAVELPKTWQPLNADFISAINLAVLCTKKKTPDFAKSCVHIHPNWIEGSDNSKLARWNLKTFVKSPVLIRGVTISVIRDLGVSKGSETSNWLHFKNGFGLRVSLLKWPVEKYPDFAPFLKLKGDKVVFQKVLSEAADRAGVLLDHTDGTVQVQLSGKKATVIGSGSLGIHTEIRTMQYEGPDISFMIAPALISELVETGTACEICTNCLSIKTKKYTYITSLESVNV